MLPPKKKIPGPHGQCEFVPMPPDEAAKYRGLHFDKGWDHLHEIRANQGSVPDRRHRLIIAGQGLGDAHIGRHTSGAMGCTMVWPVCAIRGRGTAGPPLPVSGCRISSHLWVWWKQPRSSSPYADSCPTPAPAPTLRDWSAAILIGPWLTVVVTSVALVLQALFLAHGGLSTLGANIFSMGVAGVFTGCIFFTWLGGWAEAGCSRHFLQVCYPTGLPTRLLPSSWPPPCMATVLWAPCLWPTGSGLSPQLRLGFRGIFSAGAYRFIYIRRPELLQELSGGSS